MFFCVCVHFRERNVVFYTFFDFYIAFWFHQFTFVLLDYFHRSKYRTRLEQQKNTHNLDSMFGVKRKNFNSSIKNAVNWKRKEHKNGTNEHRIFHECYCGLFISSKSLSLFMWLLCLDCFLICVICLEFADQTVFNQVKIHTQREHWRLLIQTQLPIRIDVPCIRSQREPALSFGHTFAHQFRLRKKKMFIFVWNDEMT